MVQYRPPAPRRGIADIQLPVVKAVAASGILGVSAYYQLFPDELTDEQKADIEYEKN